MNLWVERDSLIILTFDKDFGELAWCAPLPPHSGIVLFRVPMPAAQSVGPVLAARLGERDDWEGHFSVVEPARIRRRQLGRTAHPS